MIKFEHTVFALPFAYLGAVLGHLDATGTLPSWEMIGWITLAMVGARSAAMALNRLIDRHIDARNPRTKNRAIPAGLVSVPFVWGFVAVSFLLLFWAAFQLNELTVKLLPVAVFFLVFYSYTKRFTWLCHAVLGITTGLGALGGWVAATGSVNLPGLVLFIAVALWIGGFDIIYACQDHDFDREAGIHSIPARFGLGKALVISALMHAGTAVCLISLPFLTELGGWYWGGVILTLAILWREHAIVSADDLSRLDTAFFTMNSMVSIVMFIFTMADVLLR
ncbi:UbiA-like polyprenyltransferase [Staphylospora marina]|uniref:UbiA-like polyprenyltransferase n=1 Tax=Staphylospora marina TaxID=2490858 RepID=UPI000F5BCF8A|nr:UbiA-like polyprenyltransferase [Staphylospora marina]